MYELLLKCNTLLLRCYTNRHTTAKTIGTGGALRQFKSCPTDLAGNQHGYTVMAFKYLKIIIFKHICMKRTFDQSSMICLVYSRETFPVSDLPEF
mgnify:FL=1